MPDESLEGTKAESLRGGAARPSRQEAMARFLVGIGLLDQGLLESFQEQPPRAQLGSLLETLVGSGALSREQRDLIVEFAEVVLTDGEAPGDGVGETVSLHSRPAELQDTIGHDAHAASPEGRIATDAFSGYEILREIAKGGMGVVYKARQIKLDRVVALKMIRSAELADADQVRRFYAEAEAAARLDHPGIVAVYDVGSASGQHYYSMAYVEGRTLADSVAEGPLPVEDSVRIMTQVAEAVSYAHQQGIIHRDLKPANLLIDLQGQPRVADFGLAKRMSGDSGLTVSGQVLGTPSYMPPEQARGDISSVGERSDVYALGALLYTLLAGNPPFRASNFAETLRQVLENEPVSPRRLNREVPRDLETIALKCLEKQPAKRYASADEFAEELRRFRRGEPISARPIGPLGRLGKWVRRRPAFAGLISTTVLLLVAAPIGIVYYAQKQEADQQRRIAEDATASAVRSLDVAKRSVYANRVLLAERALQQDDPVRCRTLLEASDPDARRWEWHHVRNKLNYELRSFAGVEAAELSPDGSCFVTYNDPVRDSTFVKELALWDARTGKQIAALAEAPGNPHIAFSPDGALLAIGGFNRRQPDSPDARLRIYDARTGAEVRSMSVEQSISGSVAFDSESRRVGACAGKTVQIWDAATGDLQLSLSDFRLGPRDFRFSPDGASFVCANYEYEVRVRDARTGETQLTIVASDSVRQAAFSPDGEWIATGGASGVVELWDAKTGRRARVFNGLPSDLRRLRFSPDGRLLAAGSDDGNNRGQLRVWHVDSGDTQTVLHALERSPRHFTFSQDARELMLLESSGVKFCDVEAGQGACKFAEFDGFARAIRFQPRANRFAVGYSILLDDRSPPIGAACVWDLPAGRKICELPEPDGAVERVEFSPDGKTLATLCGKPVAKLWDVESAAVRSQLEGHTDTIHDVGFHPTGRELVTTSGDGTIRIWSVDDAREKRRIATADEGRSVVAYTPDGGAIIWGSALNGICVFDAQTGDKLGASDSPVPGATWAQHPFQSQLAIPDLKTTTVLDFQSGQRLLQLQGHGSSVGSVTYSPDGERVATIASDGLKLWDSATGQEILSLDTDSSVAKGVAFSSDSAYLVAGTYPRLTVWSGVKSVEAARQDRLAFYERDLAPWQAEQAERSEKNGKWFRADFHLSRLLESATADGGLQLRRARALRHLGRIEAADDAYAAALAHADLLSRQEVVESHAELGQWEEARQVSQEIVAEPGATADDWVTHALLCLKFRDAAGYVKACDVLHSRFGATRLVDTAYRIVWVTALGNGNPHPQAAVALAGKVGRARSRSLPHHVAVGAALYRAGNDEQAATALNKALKMAEESDEIALLWLAMAEFRGKKLEQARARLDTALGCAAEKTARQGLLPSWCRRLESELLRQEATETMAP